MPIFRSHQECNCHFFDQRRSHYSECQPLDKTKSNGKSTRAGNQVFQLEIWTSRFGKLLTPPQNAAPDTGLVSGAIQGSHDVNCTERCSQTLLRQWHNYLRLPL